MADNIAVTAGSGTNIASDEVTYSGDTAKLGVVRLVHVTGAEGAKTTTELVRLEDAAHTSGDPGIPLLGVRQDTAASLAGTDGDYTMPIFDSTGRQHVNVGNTVTVGSHAVTNAGTFATQIDGAALTALQLIDDPIATLGTTTYTEATTKGMIIGAIRRDADTTLVDTTNEVGPVQMNAAGQLKVEAFSGETLPVSLASVPSHAVTNAGTFAVQVDGSALTSLQLIDDAVSGAGFNITQMNGANVTMGNGASGTGVQRVTLANDSTGIVALTTSTASIGKLAANSGVDIGDTDVTSVIAGTGATNIGKAEDAAHTTGDTGVFALGVSNENATAFGAASGDYTPIATNRYGSVYVTAMPPSHASSNGTPITATTTSVIAAPSASTHLRVMRIHISNGGSTATWVSVRDGAAGTQHYRTYLPQGGVMSLNLRMSGPLNLTTATRLDIVLSAAGSVEYEIDYMTVAD